MKILRILIFLLVVNTFIILGYFAHEFTGKAVQLEKTNITRVIDGDTIDSGIGKIRLLGINTPEKNELGYQQAKDYLSQFLGKQIEAETKGKDKYGRKLAYIFYQNKLVNNQILSLGLASLYYYGKDDKYKEMKKSEQQARTKELGIWKKSKNYGCISIASFIYQEKERCKNQEQLTLVNSCQEMNLTLKDDATHIYKIKIDKNWTMNFSCIWNDDGDSVYIFDNEGLVFFKRY